VTITDWAIVIALVIALLWTGNQIYSVRQKGWKNK